MVNCLPFKISPLIWYLTSGFVWATTDDTEYSFQWENTENHELTEGVHPAGVGGPGLGRLRAVVTGNVFHWATLYRVLDQHRILQILMFF